jgi:4-hydroxythreonine-4-phosphate dehydrogenase
MIILIRAPINGAFMVLRPLSTLIHFRYSEPLLKKRMHKMLPLLLTMGDPTGVGPELIIKTLLSGDLTRSDRPIEIVGDINVLTHAARIFDCHTLPEQQSSDCFKLNCNGQTLLVHNLSNLTAEDLIYGQPNRACGVAMADYIDYAIDCCLSGRAIGIVTCPINKAAINAAGCHFPGHTELLAQRCGSDKVVMMLAGDKLKVCLVTTHLAYRDVPQTLSEKEILETIRITDHAFKTQFGYPKPRLAVLALNPHAGENGLFGDEEQRIIAPAIAAAQAEGIDATGPYSADTLFYFAAQGHYDAVICMYHDQGLIPLKLLHFQDGVNVTLGLPLIRTSVDHGTAYDLAGTGKADNASLCAALNMAAQMAHNN